MADFTVKVSYEAIDTAITQFKNCETAIKDTIEQMRNAVGNVDNTWNGSASEAYVNKFFTIYNNLRSHEQPLEETIQGLQQAVDQYKGTEVENKGLFDSIEDAQNPFGG